MRSPRHTLALTALLAALLLGACSDDGDDAATTTEPSPAATDDASASQEGEMSDEDVTEALESTAPTETVEVPSEDGATTIADYASGGSSYTPADPTELAQILATVGTDADGYLTADAAVVRTTEADAALWCQTFETMGLDTYTFIPVLPDGTGLAC